MKIKSLLIAAALVVSTQVSAGNIYKLTKEPLTINQCPILETDNAMDLALLNKGYFIVSSGKKESELLFTRHGAMGLDRNNYIRTTNGDYLLAISKKSDPKHLSKIKISMKNLAPKATTKMNAIINFPAMATEGDEYKASMTIYDSLSVTYIVTLKIAKIATGRWKTRVSIDEIDLDEGTLEFNASGTLYKQAGLNHIQWPAQYGLHELAINFKSSTQYGGHYEVTSMLQNGYPLGIPVSLDISRDGEITLLYNNGQSKRMKNRIAVALFSNPGYLEQVSKNLYRPTEQSGSARIHWAHSENAILSGYLEEACLAS